MREITKNPKKFARQCNLLIAEAPRRVTVEDVVKLTDLGLIKRHDYYSPTQDLETIRVILQFEQWREKTMVSENLAEPQNQVPMLCKMCAEPLPPRSEGKKGRPRKYCDNCESKRSSERNRKWRAKSRISFA